MLHQNEADNLLSKRAQYLFWAVEHARRAEVCIGEYLMPYCTGIKDIPDPVDRQIAMEGEKVAEVGDALLIHFHKSLLPAAGDDPFPVQEPDNPVKKE